LYDKSQDNLNISKKVKLIKAICNNNKIELINISVETAISNE